MADNDRARQRIIASVFDKRNATADVHESYVAHVKIWEDSGDGKKPRYIIISRTCTPHCTPHHLILPRRRRQYRFHPQVKAKHQRLLLRWKDLEARRAQRHTGRLRAFLPLCLSLRSLPTTSRLRSMSPLRGRTSGRQRT